ncbi:MAG: PRC-barrel domain-containing protein [Chloroflexi bacterium]|nr:PRC-barrel domain-containing protein [Chloroflexota bacterium]
MNIQIGSAVHTRDGRHVGEVHRLLVDLDDDLVTGIVVLQGRLLTRDVLVPLDRVERADDDGVVLTIDEAGLDELPDFAYNDVLVPPAALTDVGPSTDGTFYVPVQQRTRLGQQDIDLTRGAHAYARDGDIGHVDRVELDAPTGRLDAFWIRAAGIFGHEIRIPVEWVDRADESGVYVHASKQEIESQLGPPSRGPGDRESS